MDTKIEKILNSDYIISFGSFLAQDNSMIKEAIIKNIAKNDSQFIYMHPIDNIDLKVFYTQFIKYEVGSEEGVISMILDTFVKNPSLYIKEYLDELDMGYISAESSVGEEELEEALNNCTDKKNMCLIVGRDISNHERVENIIKFLSAINKYTEFDVICLDNDIQNKVNFCEDEVLEEVEDLASYNGTIVYTIYDKENCEKLIGSESFARIAKVENNDEIFINQKEKKIKKQFVINKDLMGTVALCPIIDNNISFLDEGYRYKQVQITKAEKA